MKPYPGEGLSAKHRKFNTQLSRVRVVVEYAFGRLKGRWRCLLKRNDVKLEFMSTLVTACCILHNMCEIHQDNFDQQWIDDEVIGQAGNIPSNATTIPSSSTQLYLYEMLYVIILKATKCLFTLYIITLNSTAYMYGILTVLC